MIVLDCSVISALHKLGILNLLNKLKTEIATTIDVVNEYTNKWLEEYFPDWIEIIEISSFLNEKFPKSLSNADISIISLAKEKNALLATDDKPLRNMAKRIEIDIIGSLGLLKLMLAKKILNEKEYLMLIDDLQEDLYLDKKLVKWAKELK